MQPIKYGKWALLLAVFLMQSSYSDVFTVAKAASAGRYQTIQAAVDATKKPGDEVVIQDAEVYSEQVVIDKTHNGIILRSKDIMATAKPTIKWQDKVNVGPKSVAEAKDEKNITFDRNGALIVLGAKQIRIEGIAVDGGGPMPFGYPSVWEGGGQTWPLLHGNGGISLWIASDVIIRYCDISNSYFGINVKDRNIGGVFANPNPSDIDSLDIVPFAGFAQTGNHVVEHCRIHNNSYGMYFESAWDLGSTIRYNLFYENHHTAATETALAALKNNGEVGNHVGGGAFLTKDHLLSPLAIHNNTFWHNRFMFAGIWKAGGQHLVFNNIFGAPDEYASAGSNLEMTKSMINRIHNCVYAAQAQAPTASYISILNDLPQPKAEGDLITGGLKGFPATANNIYLETKFISTTPTSANFLEPDWTNANVAKYIIDQGWDAVGIKDPDGSRADLGAIPSGGGKNVALVTVRPSIPVSVKGTTATITFSILPRLNEINNPVIKFMGIVTNLDTSDVFGNAYVAIPTSRIQTLSPGTAKLQAGSNTITATVPAAIGDFAFFEIVIEGTDSDGEKVQTSVGFIPYRKLTTKLVVTIQDPTTGKTLTEVTAGVPVKIHIEAYRDDVTKFTGEIDPIVLSLGLQNILWTPDDKKLDTLHGQMPKGIGDIPAVFHTVPIGGTDFVNAAGTSKEIAFLGASDPIKILPGAPAKVTWVDPVKGASKVVNTNSAEPLKARVFDKYDNLITIPSAKVLATSLQPTIGTITPDIAVETNAQGDAIFLAVGTGSGNKGDTFKAVASLEQAGLLTDTAICIIGEAKDQFWIYYGDTAKYDATAKLQGCSGDRLPVVIRALKSGKDISTDKSVSFDIKLSADLTAYADAASQTPITKGQLVNGQTRIWVQCTGKNVNNGQITASGPSNISSGDRRNIFFEPCENAIALATYYADNGIGSVNRLEIYYRDTLTAEQVPDSLELSWPEKSATTRIMAKRDVMKLDALNSKHVTVTINPPFAANVTKSNTANLGVSYWKNPKTPDAKVNPNPFNIADGVGPLIQAAILKERLSAGNDTIDVTFTEPVAADVVNGITLYLIKNGTATPIPLDVKKAIPVTASTVRIVVLVADNPPVVDDSLKIIATGTIVDQSGNKANPDNRAVAISLKPVPADIAKAVYFDKNADGQIDDIQITFKKIIDPTKTAIHLTWENVEQKVPDFLGAPLVLSNGNKTVDIAIDRSTFGDAIVNKTSGVMSIKATFILFPPGENERKATADDGAAPVIDVAEYHYGKMEPTVKNPDTLLLHFTEVLKDHPEPPDKVVVNGTGKDGVFTIKYASFSMIQSDGFYKYIVDQTIPATRSVRTGDSVWISIVTPDKNVVDNALNAQGNNDNKRVRLLVKILPAEIILEAGPLPFTPVTGDSMLIQLRPIVTADVETRYEVSFIIYDKVGNVVKRFPEASGTVMTGTNKLAVKWDGTNMNGRKVGTGTYLCCANGKYFSHEQTVKVEDKIKVGIELAP